MQRGMLELTKPEITLLFNLVEGPSSTLNKKLKTASVGTEENVAMEVSEEEVEAMLDALPAPSMVGITEANLAANNLRTKLSAYLLSLRNYD